MRTRSAARAAAVHVPAVGGVRVLRHVVDVGAADLVRLAALARAGTAIFNPNPHRLQTSLPPDDPIVVELTRALGDLTLGRIVGPAVVLHSLPGCERQDMHTDYDPDDVGRCAAKPLGVLLALQDGTSLCLPDGQTADLGAGDVLVFDGDQPHAGAAYASENTRVHLYLDSPGVHRLDNTTYLVVEK